MVRPVRAIRVRRDIRILMPGPVRLRIVIVILNRVRGPDHRLRVLCRRDVRPRRVIRVPRVRVIMSRIPTVRERAMVRLSRVVRLIMSRATRPLHRLRHLRGIVSVEHPVRRVRLVRSREATTVPRPVVRFVPRTLTRRQQECRHVRLAHLGM